MINEFDDFELDIMSSETILLRHIKCEWGMVMKDDLLSTAVGMAAAHIEECIGP
jgi:hypothetical protein